MRILIVGSASNYAIEKPYLHYLSQSGVSMVELFAAQNLFLEYYRKSVLNKVCYRLGFSGILNSINEKLKKEILKSTPDVVFVFKGMEVMPATLQWMRDRKIKLVNYNPDNPFVFSGKGSGNRNVSASIGLYDMHFTYNAEVKERIEREFRISTKILPFGFDISDELIESCQSQTEVVRTCFLGNPDRDRAEFIRQLAEIGIAIDVYGHDWKSYLEHSNIKVYDAVYSDEFWHTLSRYRVQLNLMRPHNPGSHNMRTFEVPGIGGILLAPDTIDHRIYFTPGKEIFLYRDIAECGQQIRKLLAMPSEQANEIRRSARSRSVNSGYSYKSRAEQVIKDFESLLRG